MTKLHRFALAFLALAWGTPAQSVVQPFYMHEDFSGDSLSQWASYPPVQDIGYDPSLSPTNDYEALGGRALMRTARPPSPGLMHFGFIKQLDMVAANAVRLSFSYRLEPATIGSLIEIGIAGGDGHKYSAQVNANSDVWSKASVGFPNIPPGTSLQAVYITARVSKADPDINYRFLIDDISLDAARVARFQVNTPHTVAVEPWRPLVSATTYASGETIAISANSPAKLAAVTGSLKDQNGRVIKAIALSLQNGAWANSSVYTVRPEDPTGVWTVELHGLTAKGLKLDTDVRLLVRPPRESIHPRLFFSSADHAMLAARTQDPKFAEAWQNLATLAREARTTGSLANGADLFQRLDPTFLLPTWRGYMTTVGHASSRIINNALVAYVTGDSDARTDAKQAMLEVAAWKTRLPPWFEAHGQHTYYPAGELAAEVSFAYDTLYDDLSPSERDLVRQALIERGVKATYREYVLDNRLMANTSNWIGHTVSGAIVSALAAMGREDDPDLNIYMGGLLLKFEDHLAASYLSDGSYGEGISYQEFDLKSTTLALEALKRVLGIDYWSHTHVKDSLGYPLYTLAHPTHNGLDMGDSHGPTAYSVAPLVEHSKDPAAHWYYDQFPHKSITDFLFPPSSLSPAPPMAVSRYFDRKGNVVFRTGWKPDDTVLLFRAGPTYNHNHSDQGAFLLRAGGEDLAVEGGYADYYNDPYYQTYFSQASGHNTVLVDDDPASQDIADTQQFPALNRYPRITDAVTSASFDAVSGELAAVYKGRLKTYTRRIAFLKPGYIVIYDDLKTGQSPAKFDWLLHVKDRDRLQTKTTSALYSGANEAMSIRALEPREATMRVRNGYLPHTVFATSMPKEVPPQPGVLDIGSGPPSAATEFLVVLGVAPTAKEAATFTSTAQRISGEGCVGVQVGENMLLFRRNGAKSASYRDWRTDGAALTSAGPLLSAELATSLVRSGKTMMKSDHPITFVAQQSEHALDLTIDAREPGRLRFYLGFQPFNTAETQYNKADGTVQLQLPAGHQEFKFSRQLEAVLQQKEKQ
jgi:hypothetical protein